MRNFYLLTSIILCLNTFADETKRVKYEYKNRDHTTLEVVGTVASVYGISWALYPLTQWDTVKRKGSTQNYKKNFGQIVFDQDEPFWNWIIHPYSGSQLFLLYRGLGYAKISSMGLAFISSGLFEFAVEIYTEPASVQDLYQTPIIGSLFGYWIETFTVPWLNSDNIYLRGLAHVLNPTTLLGFNESRITMLPIISKNKNGLFFSMDF